MCDYENTTVELPVGFSYIFVSYVYRNYHPVIYNKNIDKKKKELQNLKIISIDRIFYLEINIRIRDKRRSNLPIL